MAKLTKLYPSPFPHDLQKKPKLRGEKLVYDLLSGVLDDSWTVFYDWKTKGTRRRIDFLCISPEHGLAAFEVKGGMVHNARGKFRQLINAKTGQRKVVTPFDQVKMGFDEVTLACGIEKAMLPPCHLAIFYPEMHQSGFTFTKGLHIFTQEDLEHNNFQEKLFNALSTPTHPEREVTRRLLGALKMQKQPTRLRTEI